MASRWWCGSRSSTLLILETQQLANDRSPLKLDFYRFFVNVLSLYNDWREVCEFQSDRSLHKFVLGRRLLWIDRRWQVRKICTVNRNLILINKELLKQLSLFSMILKVKQKKNCTDCNVAEQMRLIFSGPN